MASNTHYKLHNNVVFGRYAENQELLDKEAGLVREQRETISTLERRLAAADGAGAAAAKKRIRDLEAEVDSLKVGNVPFSIFM